MQSNLSHRRAFQAGLSLRDSAVLEALIEIAQPADGELTVAMSKYALGEHLQMSADAVQRALIALRDKGLIARKQGAHVAGCVAFTTLLPQALAIFGLSPDAPAIPPALAAHLVAQPGEVVQAVARAYHERCLPADAARAAYCGTQAQWCCIESILRARLPCDANEGADASNVRVPDVEVRLSDGSIGRIDMAALTEQCPLPLDAAFVAAAVLAVVVIVQPRDARALARLTAEIAFSRCAGFVRDHGSTHGVNVLRRVVSRGGWSRPRRMTSEWYAMTERACSSTASAAHVH